MRTSGGGILLANRSLRSLQARVRRKVPGLFVFLCPGTEFSNNRKRQAVEAVVESNIRLTGREAEVLCLIARGLTHSQIAGQLGVSGHTVVSHIRNCYRKLDVHSGAAAVMRAVQLRLLDA